MKIKNEFIEAFSSQKLVSTNQPSKRYNRSLDVFTLEAKDFDKAIDLLKVFNRKAGVKEFELLKSEFVSGSNCEDRIYSPNNFVEHLKDVLTKRMSDVESRIALKKVDDAWNFDEAYEIDNAYKRVSYKYHEFINCKEKHERQVKYQESMLKIKLELVEDIKSWMKEEVEENENSLDALSINDWNDISHILECCSERLEELHTEHLKTMTR